MKHIGTTCWINANHLFVKSFICQKDIYYNNMIETRNVASNLAGKFFITTTRSYYYS